MCTKKGPKSKKPCLGSRQGSCKIGRRPTLPPVTAVPSALAGLTSLFGMGRGGHRRYRHLNILMFNCPLSDQQNNDMYWKKKRKRKTTVLSALRKLRAISTARL